MIQSVSRYRGFIACLQYQSHNAHCGCYSCITELECIFTGMHVNGSASLGGKEKEIAGGGFVLFLSLRVCNTTDNTSLDGNEK